MICLWKQWKDSDYINNKNFGKILFNFAIVFIFLNFFLSFSEFNALFWPKNFKACALDNEYFAFYHIWSPG